MVENFKGTKPSKRLRKSRKRGKQVKKRGIMNRFNGVITVTICTDSNDLNCLKMIKKQ